MNVAHVLDRAAVPVVLAAGLAAGVVILIRHAFPDMSRPWLLPAACALPLLAGIVVWWRARAGFLTIEQALVKLDVRHGLHAALSTAWVGAGPWPALPASAEDGLHWRWMRTSAPPLLALLLVSAAWWMPVTARTAAARLSEPASWALVESDLKTMVEERLVDESSTQEQKQAIEALRARPQDQWFDHSSIEAGDRLLQAHRQEMSALETRMREAARAMRQAAEAQPGMPNAALDPAAMDAMLEGLRDGGLRPDPELLQRMAELAQQNGIALNQLDPQQLAELLERMEQNARRLAEMRERLQGMCENGMCEEGACEGEGLMALQEGDNGAPTRGPGEGGPLFGEEKSGPDAQQDKPLPTGDLSQAAPGDVLGVAEGSHEVDESVSPALRAGGAPVQPGDGGAAVWSDTLHPREQEALRRFFE